MSNYNPDNWVILKITSEEGGVAYKVLAGWSGSYMYGSSWQLNSGIVKVEDDGEYFRFQGVSGSTYNCHKEQYKLRLNNGPIYTSLKEKFPDSVELMDENTDWSKLIMENVNGKV